MEEPRPSKPSLKSRLAVAFRPKASAKKLTKEQPADHRPKAIRLSSEELPQSPIQTQPPITKNIQTPPAPVKEGPVNFYNKNTTGNQAQTGELWDEAEMLHSLLRRDSHDSMNSIDKRARERQMIPDPSRAPGEEMIASLPPALWDEVASHMTPTDAANLAFSSKTLLSLLGPQIWSSLNHLENHQDKIDFLLPMDHLMPDHLFCFPCAKYHVRIQKGKERLRPKHVLNPIFNCPNPKQLSKHRITPDYTLPFPLLQLVFRHHLYGPECGIPLDSLNRRFKCRNSAWTHQTRFHFHKNHLLLRITSKSFAVAGLPPSGLRHFLYCREDYTPYFSVCAHWRDGELMNLCKCAMSHIPFPKETIAQQLRSGPAIQLARLNPKVFVTLCQECRPMRRCPECPSEYLIELKLEEDRYEPDPNHRFKQCLSVTRWVDLGDGKDPGGGEWAAVTGEGKEKYDSFGKMGRRAIAGIFESQYGVTIPGQRVLSLNPRNEKLGERGHNWY